MTYTTLALVKEHIDSSWLGDGTGQIPDATITAKIPFGSEYVQGFLPNYHPFPLVSATIPTPYVIQTAASMATAALCYDQLRMSNHLEDDSEATHLRAVVAELLKPFRDGEQTIPRVTVTAEDISWGLNAPVDTGLHLFACTPYEVIPQSVAITGYENGIDFWCRYDSRYRGWVLVQGNSAIIGVGEDPNTVSYDYTYLRTVHETEAPQVTNVSIVLA